MIRVSSAVKAAILCTQGSSVLPKRTASTVDKNSKQQHEQEEKKKFFFLRYFPFFSLVCFNGNSLFDSIYLSSARFKIDFSENFSKSTCIHWRILKSSQVLRVISCPIQHTNRVPRLLFVCMGIHKWLKGTLCMCMCRFMMTTVTTKAKWWTKSKQQRKKIYELLRWRKFHRIKYYVRTTPVVIVINNIV